MAADVHAVVVGVESTEAELHADNVGDGATVLDVPALVVADGGDPTVAVWVVLVHECGGLLGEGLAGRVPVLEREELVKDGVEDTADGLASAARFVADDLGVGRGGLALVQVGGEVEDLGGYAVLLCMVRKRWFLEGMWRSYAGKDNRRQGVRLGNGCGIGKSRGHDNQGDGETHGDGGEWWDKSDS